MDFKDQFNQPAKPGENPSIGIIIQARMTSTRLPGKILMPVIDNKSMLEVMLTRLRNRLAKGKIVVATTDNLTDDPVIEECKRLGVDTFRGSENNVLDRYYQCAKVYGFDIIVRLTSDCPAIDPEIVNDMLDVFCGNSYDYISNTLERTFPRGMDVEVFSTLALWKAKRNANTELEQEHVTAHIYDRRNNFIVENFKEKNQQDYSKWRLTVDTEADYHLVRDVFWEAKEYWDNPAEVDYIYLVSILEHMEEDASYLPPKSYLGSMYDAGKQTKYESSQYYKNSNI